MNIIEKAGKLVSRTDLEQQTLNEIYSNRADSYDQRIQALEDALGGSGIFHIFSVEELTEEEFMISKLIRLEDTFLLRRGVLANYFEQSNLSL